MMLKYFKVFFLLSILQLNKITASNGGSEEEFLFNSDIEEKFKIMEHKIDLLLKEIEKVKTRGYFKYAELDGDRCQHNLEPYNILDIRCPNDIEPKNCFEVNECIPHLYYIKVPYYDESFPVACDLKTENGGWTIIQRRQDGSVNFYRKWTDYVKGFGNLNGEFFIGLEKLHLLTAKEEPQELYIILEDFEGELCYAEYKVFKVDSKETGYKLTVGNYSGNAGDSFGSHSGYKFSTWDNDNDSEDNINCAELRKGGWWYHSCYNSHLNGRYLLGAYPKTYEKQGASWGHFRSVDYSLKFIEMMIRPQQKN